MLRVVFFGFFLFLISASGAQAQEAVRVRAGEHDEYVRLVFDWGKPVTYTASTPSPGQLVLKFASAGTLDDSAFRADPPRNIGSIKVISQSPLEVAIATTNSSTTRDFSAGGRVVVDVYDAQPITPEKPAEKQPEKKPEPAKPEPAKKAEAPKPPEKKIEEKKAEEKKPEPAKVAAVPVQPVLAQTIPPKPVGATPTVPAGLEDLKKLQEETPVDAKTGVAARPNIVTLTATKSTGLAVYERAGRVWLVSDQEDLMVSPHVSGPNAKEMTPPGTLHVTGAKIFILPKLGGKYVQGQGGGLLWRVVIAPQEIHVEGIKPQRIAANPDGSGPTKILWPLQETGRVIDVPDPVSGKTLKVVTVGSSKQMSGPAQSFIDFEILNSPVGMAILPKVDDLKVEITRKGVEISRPGGLAVMPEKNISAAYSYRAAEAKKPEQNKLPEKRIFDFNNWKMGGMETLETNRTAMLSGLGGKKPDAQIEGLLTLARMHLANGLWAEAMGFLSFAQESLPELEQNPEYIALNGASLALGRVSDLAFESLSDKQLEGYPEIGYWKAYALADLEDWQQAAQVLPANTDILSYYPEVLLVRLGLVLSEVALRSGKLDEAETILKLIDDHGGGLVFQQKAALDYLKGEALRQRGKPAEALTAWKPLTTGKDALYRAKSGLAITRLQYEKKEIKPQQAIDNLERLRYAWRGDELEALINYWLGKVYFDTGDYIKGLTIMKDGASFAEDTDLGDRINAEISETFVTLFTGPALQKVSGPDSAALYKEFAPLIPPGEKSDLVAEKLADHLVNKDLPDQAALLLQTQMQHRQGLSLYGIATKLAATLLLDGKSTNALVTLNKANGILEQLPVAEKTPARYQELALLRARALSQERRPDQALALLMELPRSQDVNNLRADIAWRAGYWDDAGEALGDVINDRNISLTRPLSAEDTALLLQRSVALNLANDRIALANMREKYTDAMAQTDKARIFEVITRPRQSGALADRKTLMGIVSEVDLFKDFLTAYKGAQAPAPAAQGAPAAGVTPPAATTPPATTPPATPPAN